MTEAEIFDRLRPWVMAATGLPEVIADHPGAPRPSLPYGMINIIRSGPVHEHAFDRRFAPNPAHEDDGDLQPVLERPQVEWEWMASINAYATDAGDRLRGLRMWIASPGAEALLSPLVVASASEIRRLPELVGERWEGRAQMDMTIRGLVAADVPIDVIEEATASFRAARTVAAPQPPMSEDEPFGTATATKPQTGG